MEAQKSIPIENILAVQYHFYDRLKNNFLAQNMSFIKEILGVITLMDAYKIDLPIIDGSDNSEIRKDLLLKYNK